MWKIGSKNKFYIRPDPFLVERNQFWISKMWQFVGSLVVLFINSDNGDFPQLNCILSLLFGWNSFNRSFQYTYSGIESHLFIFLSLPTIENIVAWSQNWNINIKLTTAHYLKISRKKMRKLHVDKLIDRCTSILNSLYWYTTKRSSGLKQNACIICVLAPFLSQT